LAEEKAGVIAWTRRGDPDRGEWVDDGVIPFMSEKLETLSSSKGGR
jgi:hypothetical protein